jgi:hypothetical protein
MLPTIVFFYLHSWAAIHGNIYYLPSMKINYASSMTWMNKINCLPKHISGTGFIGRLVHLVDDILWTKNIVISNETIGAWVCTINKSVSERYLCSTLYVYRYMSLNLHFSCEFWHWEYLDFNYRVKCPIITVISQLIDT